MNLNLEENEQILYESDAHIDTKNETKKTYLVYLLVIVIFLFFLWPFILILFAFVAYFNLILILLALVFVISCATFKRKIQKISLRKYYVTNKRIIVCDQNKIIQTKEILNIDFMQLTHTNNEYGDLIFCYYDDNQRLKRIFFTGCKYPKDVIAMIQDIDDGIEIHANEATGLLPDLINKLKQ